VRTTIDIPDPIYRELKARAAKQGRTVKELILSGVQKEMQDPSPQSAAFGFYLFTVKERAKSTSRAPKLTRSFLVNVNVWVAVSHNLHVHHEKLSNGLIPSLPGGA
jgi:hypothetical protein